MLTSFEKRMPVLHWLGLEFDATALRLCRFSVAIHWYWSLLLESTYNFSHHWAGVSGISLV